MNPQKETERFVWPFGIGMGGPPPDIRNGSEEEQTMQSISKRVRIVSVALAAVMCFTGCSGKSAPLVQNRDMASGPVSLVTNTSGSLGRNRVGTATGYYNVFHSFDHTAINILYTDYSTHQQIYLCDNPACTHHDEGCASWFGDVDGGSLLFGSPDGEAIYYAALGAEEPTQDEIDPSPRIYAMNPDGTNRHVLTKIKGAGRLVDAVAADSKYLYFDVNTVESITARPFVSLMRTDRKTGETVTLAKKIPDTRRLLSAYGSKLIYQDQLDDKNIYYEFDLNTNQFRELLCVPYDAYEGKEMVYGKDLFVLAKTAEESGTLVIYDFETQEKQEIKDVPIYAGDTCNFAGLFDDTNLVIDNTDHRDPSNIQKKRHIVNLKTGEVTESTLTYHKDGENRPIQILADAGDSLLISSGSEQRMVAALKDGVAETAPQELPVLRLIAKEDFFSSQPSYISIENQYAAG